jgi:hypothetical protein
LEIIFIAGDIPVEICKHLVYNTIHREENICMVLRIIAWVLSSVYGLLMVIASVWAIMGRVIPYWISGLIILAAVLLIVGNAKILPKNIFFVILSLLIIQGCTLLDSYYMDEFYITHHIARLAVHGILFALIFVSQRDRK